MQNFKPKDKVRILDTNSNEDWGIAGRTGIVTDSWEENPETELLNIYLVEVDGNDEKSGQYELAEYEMEHIDNEDYERYLKLITP